MCNLIQKTTDLAIHILSAYVREDSVVIDATCGGGHDTLRLAQMNPRRLIAFDLQEEAAKATRARLTEAGYGKALADGRIQVVCTGHEHMADFFMQGSGADGRDRDGIPGERNANDTCGFVQAVVFNLGYLPGGDKSITTEAGTTIAAVERALKLLAPDGVICLTVYSGHPQGKKEKAALLAFAEGLDPHLYHTAYIQMTNQKKDPPEILLITKKAR